MEQRGVLLRGIARVLNAGGCTLLSIYDAATSIKIKTSVLPGEKGSLQAQLREYEKKMERLYYEIGKEVALREYTTQTSAAGEAGIKLAAEYRVKIEKVKQRIKEIEEEEKAAREAAIKGAETKAEPVADAGEPAASAAPVASEVSTDAVTEEGSARVAGAAETPEHELQKDTTESAAPVAGEVSTDAVTEGKATTEALEAMLKSDLLELCMEKGIEADKRMTKAEIIALILGR